MLKALMISTFVFAATPTPQENQLPPLKEETVEEHSSLAALRKVQSFMENVNSLEAHFRQRSQGGAIAEGTLYMERPGKIRFDYDGDIPFLMVADGKTLNFVDYEIGQVTKWPVKDTPLRALLGKSTDLASIGAHVEANPAGVVGLIALTANDPDKPELGQITIYFEEEETGPLKLLSWVAIDAQNQMTTVDLENQKVNIPVSAKLWEFDDPRGVNKRRRNRR